MATFTKPYQIKAWPEMEGLLSLLMAQDPLKSSQNVKFHLDFTHLHKVDASGLAIFLARLLHIKNLAIHSSYALTLPLNNAIKDKLINLNIGKTLNELGLSASADVDLFNYSQSALTHNYSNSLAEETLITIIPGGGITRDELISKVKKEIKGFLKYDAERSFAHEQIILILLEMVKNTYDHSGLPAILGLNFSLNSQNKKKISFSYCDTGKGICQSVRHHIAELTENSNTTDQLLSDKAQLTRLYKKGAFADILRWALTPGYSTKKGNGINFGLGMMLIAEGARNCGMRLSLKDADSIWLISELSYEQSSYSHSEIRKFGTKTCTPPLMMFHGELEYGNE